MKRFTIEVQRSHIVIANAFIKNIKAPGALLLGKLSSRIDRFLEEYPGDKYRVTAESIDDPDTATRADREAEEEQSDPRGHFR